MNWVNNNSTTHCMCVRGVAGGQRVVALDEVLALLFTDLKDDKLNSKIDDLKLQINRLCSKFTHDDHGLCMEIKKYWSRVQEGKLFSQNHK